MRSPTRSTGSFRPGCGDAKLGRAEIHLVDPAPVVLAPFSEHAHAYAQRVLEQRGREAGAGREGRRGQARSGQTLRRSGDPHPHGGVGGRNQDRPSSQRARGFPRRTRRADSRSAPTSRCRRFPGVYALGDVANTLGARRLAVPAAGIGGAAGRDAGRPTTSSPTSTGSPARPFRYRDKGIMAMIGRNAAVAEIGPRRRELHGSLAYASWLGVHAWLLSGIPRAGQRARGLGMGLRRHDARVGVHQPTRRDPHRLGRVAPCARPSARWNVGSAASPRSSWPPGELPWSSRRDSG